MINYDKFSKNNNYAKFCSFWVKFGTFPAKKEEIKVKNAFFRNISQKIEFSSSMDLYNILGSLPHDVYVRIDVNKRQKVQF